MTKALWSVGLAVAMSATAAGQVPVEQEKEVTMEQEVETEGSMTLKGCLKRQGADFVLTVVETPAPADRPMGTTGTAATPAISYRLVEVPATIALADHVGHTVEIVGMTKAAAEVEMDDADVDTEVEKEVEAEPEQGEMKTKVETERETDADVDVDVDKDFAITTLRHVSPTCQ